MEEREDTRRQNIPLHSIYLPVQQCTSRSAELLEELTRSECFYNGTDEAHDCVPYLYRGEFMHLILIGLSDVMVLPLTLSCNALTVYHQAIAVIIQGLVGGKMSPSIVT